MQVRRVKAMIDVAENTIIFGFWPTWSSEEIMEGEQHCWKESSTVGIHSQTYKAAAETAWERVWKLKINIRLWCDIVILNFNHCTAGCKTGLWGQSKMISLCIVGFDIMFWLFEIAFESEDLETAIHDSDLGLLTAVLHCPSSLQYSWSLKLAGDVDPQTEMC